MFGITGNSRRSGTLSGGQTEVLKHLQGHQVRCTSGTLWVTLEGDERDYFLSAPESLPIPDRGMVVLSGDGTYQLSRIQEAGRVRMLDLSRLGGATHGRCF
jgi:hypothetical protein